VTVNNSFNYTITASSSVATTTNFSIGGILPAGLSFASSMAQISGIPNETGTFNITLTATTDCDTDTETLIISVNPAGSAGGGGGGGGGGGRGRGFANPGEVLGAATVADFCPYLTSYLKYGQPNDPMQVIKLQAFLKAYEKHDYVNITGVFDEATLRAVNAFQMKYQDEILNPWGLEAPTGYVYKLTLAKINEIICGSSMPHLEKAPASAKEGMAKEGASGNVESLPIIGENVYKGQKYERDTIWLNIASSLFTWPETALDTMRCFYEVILILAVLYILASVLENVLYKETPENVLKRFRAKWITATVGLVVAIFGAYLLKESCLILPLLIALVMTVAWVLYGKDTSVGASVKSWYMARVSGMRGVIKRNFTRAENSGNAEKTKEKEAATEKK